jgi:tRNA(Ile)-lysidine synthase
MASSRRSPRPADGEAYADDEATRPVDDALRRALEPLSARAGARIAVALSGGRDSIVLLDAASRVAPELGIALCAAHVHHGLSPNADAWERFCAAECERRGIPLETRRVDVPRAGADGIEAAARRARYQALAGVDADAVALAHHADDQAETVLLQLLRGAGPHGLAAMPPARSAGRATFVRPLLEVRRAAIERYAAARALAWIDDESNADRARTRNFVRHELAPRIAAAFAGYPATLVRAASHQGDAARLADDLAELDARGALHDGALARERLASLANAEAHRARNLLRWFLRANGLRAPSTARLEAMLEQIAHAPPDARVRLRHDGAEIGIHRGRVVVHDAPVAPFAIAWRGEGALALPHGTLEFAPSSGHGIAAAAREHAVVVRSREGGERLRLSAGAAAQPLKQLLQRAGIPHWARASVPLVFCGDTLAAVPGIGIDPAFAADAGAPGYELRWHPRTRAFEARGER